MIIKELVEKEDKVQLAVFEALGCLILMSHWLRGMIDALVQNERIELSEEEKENWDRVISKLSLYEEIVWEIAPSRLMLLELRNYRLTKKIRADKIDLMLKQDTHGRIPYGLTQDELKDIESIIRKLKDARQVPYGHGYGLLGQDI